MDGVKNFCDLSRNLFNFVDLKVADLLVHESCDVAFAEVSRDVFSEVLPESEKNV